MGLSGAAAGTADVLQSLLAQKRAEFLQNQQLQMQQADSQRQAEQFAQQMALRRDEFDYGKRRDDVADQRTARLDDIAAGERRQKENVAGARRMIGDFLVQRGATPLDAGSRQTLQGMALQEGIDLPNEIATDPEKAQRDRIALAELQHKFQLGEIAAQGAEARRTVTAKADAETPTGSAYSNERAARTVQSVDELIGQVNRWTAGFGSAIAGLPETDARSLRAQLDTLKSNIAFNELSQMREASKTGGALGAVSERELALLESTLGALDQGLSPDVLKQQLEKVKQSVLRWQAAKALGGPTPLHGGTPTAPIAPMSSHGTPQAAPTTVRWGRDAQGRPVPLR